jgi:hypothetical protein
MTHRFLFLFVKILQIKYRTLTKQDKVRESSDREGNTSGQMVAMILLPKGQKASLPNVHAAPRISSFPEPMEMKWKNALAKLRTELELCTGNPVIGLKNNLVDEAQREKERHKEDCGVVLQKIREEVELLLKNCDQDVDKYNEGKDETQQELQRLDEKSEVQSKTQSGGEGRSGKWARYM